MQRVLLFGCRPSFAPSSLLARASAAAATQPSHPTTATNDPLHGKHHLAAAVATRLVTTTSPRSGLAARTAPPQQPLQHSLVGASPLLGGFAAAAAAAGPSSRRSVWTKSSKTALAGAAAAVDVDAVAAGAAVSSSEEDGLSEAELAEEIDEIGEVEMERRFNQLDRDQQIKAHVISINRTVKVTMGGRNLRYKSLVVAGDGKGRIGFGYCSGLDSRQANDKAHKRAVEMFMEVPLWRNRSLYHDVVATYNSTKVMVRRAPFGNGIRAGRVQWLMCDAVGIRDAVCKVWGSTNEQNIVRATLVAFSKARSLHQECQMRGVDERLYLNPLEDSLYDDRLYRGGDFTFEELTGRPSKFDLKVAIPAGTQYGDTDVGVVGDYVEEERPDNPRIAQMDRIAEANERRFLARRPVSGQASRAWQKSSGPAAANAAADE